MGEKLGEVLKSHGFHHVQDLLGTDVERLAALPGIGDKMAEKLIQTARAFDSKK